MANHIPASFVVTIILLTYCCSGHLIQPTRHTQDNQAHLSEDKSAILRAPSENAGGEQRLDHQQISQKPLEESSHHDEELMKEGTTHDAYYMKLLQENAIQDKSFSGLLLEEMTENFPLPDACSSIRDDSPRCLQEAILQNGPDAVKHRTQEQWQRHEQVTPRSVVNRYRTL